MQSWDAESSRRLFGLAAFPEPLLSPASSLVPCRCSSSVAARPLSPFAWVVARLGRRHRLLGMAPGSTARQSSSQRLVAMLNGHPLRCALCLPDASRSKRRWGIV